MIIDNKYTTVYTPMYSLMDAKARVSSFPLMNLTQDLASAHYSTGGLSMIHLQDKGQTWVLTKQKFEFFEYPLGFDRIIMQTWAHEPKGLFCVRDYKYSFSPDGKKASFDESCKDIMREESEKDFEVKEENLIMKASSAWMILDLDTGRPLKANDFSMGALTFNNEDAIEGGMSKIAIPETWDKEVPLTPNILDIDLNDHVNNMSYIRWILSLMDYDYCSTRLLKSLETNFVTSALFGDNLLCRYKMTDDNTWVHSIVREDGTETFRARTVWANEKELARDRPLYSN